ncbi:MAG: HAD hydrolase-like protein [Eubacterium sp.]|nr:HAD hydrolase-like protein [Eubacterium sp.]
MQKKLFLFDMDGTTNESGPGIKKSVAIALEKQGITDYTEEQLAQFVGPPLRQSFQNLFGMTEEQASQGIQDYRAYYAVSGKFENRMYPGIPELLKRMKQAGILCGIASSKPELFVREILEHYNVEQYFDVIAGASMSEQLVEKPDIIRLALQRAREQGLPVNSVPSAEAAEPTQSSSYMEPVQPQACPDVWMVGDRSYDVTGAHSCGLPVIGVTYGYGSRRELEDAGADVIVDTTAALESAIFSIVEHA